MKRKLVVILLVVISICALAMMICACTSKEEEPPKDDTNIQNNEDVSLTFYAEDNALKGQTAFTLKRGQDCEFKLTIAEGYCLESVNYSGECLVLGKVGEVLVAMQNVRYDEAVKVEVSKCTSRIFYHLNGGTFLEKVTSTLDYYGDVGQSKTHLRKNTSIGTDTIYRAGYTQIGWNTVADGSGQHIGLGSRVTVKDNTTLTLFAEWAKWSDGGLFEYEDSGTNGITITAYRGGDSDVLVIPEEIDGKRVIEIADGIANSKRIDTLILHRFIEYVGDNRLCLINNIYLSDGVKSFEKGGFNENIKKCFLNAAVAPRMIGKNSNGIFAESLDRLILNLESDKNNLVFFGGCSLTYGLDCALINEAFGGKYYITDVGVNGDAYMPFQFDVVIAYLKKGDVLIHAPEMASEQSMLIDSGAKEDCDWMLFSAIESNYDLLSVVDISGMPDIFTALANFNAMRLDLSAVTYEETNSHFNEYGDCQTLRNISVFSDERLTFNTDGVDIYDKFMAMSAYSRLNEYYQRAHNNGASIYFTYAPCNVEATKCSGEFANRAWNDYDALMKSLLDSSIVKIISNPYDYIFDKNYFYDTDYHLTSKGAILRTNQIISDMQRNGI